MKPPFAVLISSVAFLLSATLYPQNSPSRTKGLIAHIRHGEISFSVSVDERTTEPSILRVIIPQKIPADPSRLREPKVRATVKMRDDNVHEGVPEKRPSIANGGWVDSRYELLLRKGVSVGDIFSVTLTIGAEEYELFAF
jgi:hypothetical protein